MSNSLKLCAAATLLLAACATTPTGPSTMVLPGSNKSFEQFRADDAVCRQFAYDQVAGLTSDRAAVDSGVKSAAVGALLGAAAGAAIDGGHGAAVGAGTGLLFGGLAGTGAAQASGYDAQRRYDHGFTQCMYAKGHRVPVYGRYATQRRDESSYLPPPPPPPPR